MDSSCRRTTKRPSCARIGATARCQDPRNRHDDDAHVRRCESRPSSGRLVCRRQRRSVAGRCTAQTGGATSVVIWLSSSFLLSSCVRVLYVSLTIFSISLSSFCTGGPPPVAAAPEQPHQPKTAHDVLTKAVFAEVLRYRYLLRRTHRSTACFHFRPFSSSTHTAQIIICDDFFLVGSSRPRHLRCRWWHCVRASSSHAAAARTHQTAATRSARSRRQSYSYAHPRHRSIGEIDRSR